MWTRLFKLLTNILPLLNNPTESIEFSELIKLVGGSYLNVSTHQLKYMLIKLDSQLQTVVKDEIIMELRGRGETKLFDGVNMPPLSNAVRPPAPKPMTPRKDNNCT